MSPRTPIRSSSRKTASQKDLQSPGTSYTPKKEPSKSKKANNRKNIIELKDISTQTTNFDEADKKEKDMKEDELNTLNLEICKLKNINDNLEKKVEMLKAKEQETSKCLSGEVSELQSKIEKLDKQVKLSKEIISYNEKLKQENNVLQEKVNDADRALCVRDALQDKLDSTVLKLVEAEKVILKNNEMKSEIEQLKMQLEISNKTLEKMKTIFSQISQKSNATALNESSNVTDVGHNSASNSLTNSLDAQQNSEFVSRRTFNRTDKNKGKHHNFQQPYTRQKCEGTMDNQKFQHSRQFPPEHKRNHFYRNAYNNADNNITYNNTEKPRNSTYISYANSRARFNSGNMKKNF